MYNQNDSTKNAKLFLQDPCFVNLECDVHDSMTVLGKRLAFRVYSRVYALLHLSLQIQHSFSILMSFSYVCTIHCIALNASNGTITGNMHCC